MAPEPPTHKPSDDPSDPKGGDDDDEGSKKNEDLDDDSNDDLLGEEMDHDIESNNRKNQTDKRSTSAPSGSRTRAACLQPHTPVGHLSLENSLLSNLQGDPMTKSYLDVTKKSHKENCGNHLLPQFEAAVNCTDAIGPNPLLPLLLSYLAQHPDLRSIELRKGSGALLLPLG